jgi:gluconate 2-dehydrogenase gamma chain
MNRREFVQYSVLLIGSTLFAQKMDIYSSHLSILQEPYQTIAEVHEVLFTPSAGMPRPQNFNAIGFLQGVMKDPRVHYDQKELIKNGVTWLNMTSKEKYQKKYRDLSLDKQEKILQYISQKEWGNDWIWYIMNHAFEAMLSDPVYGANTNKIGWKWLDYTPGYPRPPRINSGV